MLRDIMQELLVTQDDIEVVGEVDTADRLVGAVEELGADFVIIGGDQLEVPDAWLDLLGSAPGLRLLAVASRGRRMTLCELLGDASPRGLVEAIRVARGPIESGPVGRPGEGEDRTCP
jgi:hypothetical protein